MLEGPLGQDPEGPPGGGGGFRRSPSGRDWRVALEYYMQTGDQPDDAPGQLANQDLFPDLDAIMVRANFDFDW